MKKLLLISILFVSGFAFGQIPGLIHEWSFNTGTAQDDIATDDGTVNGATLTTDRFGNPDMAFAFDGNNDNITVPSPSHNFGENTTISFWVLIDGGATGDHFMFDCRNPSFSPNHGPVGYLDLNNSHVEHGIDGASINKYDTTIVFDDWMHFVFIQDTVNSEVKVYMNGVQLIGTAQFQAFIDPVYEGFPLVFGARADNSTSPQSHLEGKMDDIKIFGEVLTDAEVLELYNEANPLACGSTVDAIHEWSFNSGTAQDDIASDDGTVNGATLTTDRFGNPNMAYAFDGNNDNITVPSPSHNFGTSTSISMWVWINSGSNGNHYLFDTRNPSFSPNLGPTAYLDIDNNHVEHGIDGSSINKYDTTIVTDQWVHFVFVQDTINNEVNAFMNGVQLVGTAQFQAFVDPVYEGFPLIFGARADDAFSPQTHLNGKIDDIKIFDQALCVDEVLVLYQEEDPTASVHEIKSIGLKIYPNPTEDNFVISKSADNNIEQVIIIDMAGRTVKNISGNISSFSLRDLEIGTYLVRVKLEGIDTIQTLKVVRN